MYIATKLYYTLFIFLLLTSCSTDIPNPATNGKLGDDYVQRGRELYIGLAACGYCHGDGRNPSSLPIGGRAHFDRYGEVRAANLTPSESGIGAWNLTEIVEATRSSVARGELISWDVHRGYEWMSDTDAYSIASYLKSLPPVHSSIERRHLTFTDRNTVGFFESRPRIKGVIPKVSKKAKMEYGKYLVENVARCTQCHNTQGSLITAEKYLQGGATIKNDLGEAVAPGLDALGAEDNGRWTQRDLVRWLASGVSKGRGNKFLLCPVPYYRTAPHEDLEAIAGYILATK